MKGIKDDATGRLVSWYFEGEAGDTDGDGSPGSPRLVAEEGQTEVELPYASEEELVEALGVRGLEEIGTVGLDEAGGVEAVPPSPDEAPTEPTVEEKFAVGAGRAMDELWAEKGYVASRAPTKTDWSSIFEKVRQNAAGASREQR